jgi:NitT/TauT family transport system ATP-binding protein
MSDATPSTQFADERTEGAVRIQGVDKIYPVQNGAVTALKDVNVSVGGGEFVSILGPSGCGKSTLLRCVAGLDRPTSGSITLGGSKSMVRRSIWDSFFNATFYSTG